MPKTYGAVTERLLAMKPGTSIIVNQARVNYCAPRKHAPGAAWKSETVDGRLLVTRIR